jgi:hypothetical protein
MSFTSGSDPAIATGSGPLRSSSWSVELLAAVSDETLTQLEKNVKILKALETEHVA